MKPAKNSDLTIPYIPLPNNIIAANINTIDTMLLPSGLLHNTIMTIKAANIIENKDIVSLLHVL